MNNDLSNLPPPPKGQTGINPEVFSHLPPPPKGVKGLTLGQAKAQATSVKKPLPITTDGDSGSFTKNFFSSVKDEATGAVKTAINGTRSVAGMLQGLGQRVMARAETPSGDTDQFNAKLADVKKGPEIKSLDDTTPEGKNVSNLLQPKSQAEKTGSYIETAAEAGTGLAGGSAEELLAKGKGAVKSVGDLFNGSKTAGEKALSLSEKELSAVDKTKLKYLTDKGFDMAKTEGGVLKAKSYKMTDQVKKLASEFGDILTGKTPEENIKSVQTELGRLQQESKSAFDGVNKSINKDTLVSGIKKAIGKMSDSVYEGYTKEQQAAFGEKRINDFLSHVKDGTLKGLDDALESFRSANAKNDSTISKAADTTYQAVKKYIVENLPEDKAAIYKTANQSQAKLFDVAEILKGKIQASVGELSKAGKALKYGAGAIGAGLGTEAIRKIVTGGF